MKALFGHGLCVLITPRIPEASRRRNVSSEILFGSIKKKVRIVVARTEASPEEDLMHHSGSDVRASVYIRFLRR